MLGWQCSAYQDCFGGRSCVWECTFCHRDPRGWHPLSAVGILNALHVDSSDGKIQCPTVDAVLCENCAIAESCLLEVSWGMKSTRDVGVDISDLLCPKLFVYMCCDATHAPCCQAWLFEVVFGMLRMHWRVKKVSYRACGERIRLTTMRSHGTPDTFFQTPKRAHVLKSGRKRMVITHFCVPMGGSGIPQLECKNMSVGIFATAGIARRKVTW